MIASTRKGRRGRRVRRVVITLGITTLVGLAVGLALWWARRPAVYRPGEELPEITRRLARELPAGAPEFRFTDVTAAAGLGGFRSFAGGRTSQLPEDMGSGAAWGDFDNDGDDDLFLVSAGGGLDLPAGERAPSELYENLGDGAFRKVAGFPDLRIVGMAAAWGDADGDGWLDLAVSGYDTLLLLRNREGTLVPDDALPALPGFWTGAAWGDFDNDRDLDLYVCGYVRYAVDPGARGRTTQQYGSAVPFTLNPASFEPERNLLLRNEGDGSFAEVAALYGVSNPQGRSLGALWRDFDDDGRLDLYVANDLSDNALYLNRGETFEDAGLSAWVADYRGAMGLAAGDWDRDGDDDLFVTHWVAQENALYDSRLRETPVAEGGAPLTFSDLAARLGLGQIALPFVGWGTEFADLDGDGWLDLLVANGSTFETDEQPPRLVPQRAFLFWNHRGEGFHDLAATSEVLSTPRAGRGLAVADYDADGDLDVVIVDHGEGARLLRNDTPQGNWMELSLRSRDPSGAEPRGFADGARVFARTGEVVLRRAVTGASYLSQSSRVVHLGLGAAERVDEVEVRWLGGVSERWSGLAANQRWELREGDPTPRRMGPGPGGERQRLAEFWSTQRAAMNALKRDGDTAHAAVLFRHALALDPRHEDARYYLAACLAAEGHTDEALDELARLAEINPQSHRAHKQWGRLRVMTAATDAELAAAEAAFERALALNPEETGSLLALGEVALLRGNPALAAQRLEWACRTNPRAVGGFFLRAYLAWSGGDEAESRRLLAAAGTARGEDWKPEGAVAEGDVATKMHREESPLAAFWRGWDGRPEPAAAFAPLARFLASRTPAA